MKSVGITVAIDGYRLVAEPKTSGAVYAAELIQALINQNDIDRIYILLSSKPDQNFTFKNLLHQKKALAIYPQKPANPETSTLGNIKWIQIQIPNLLSKHAVGISYYIAPYHQTPILIPKTTRVATIIHDFCGLKRNSGYHPLMKQFYVHIFNFISAWLRADILIPISDFTRKDTLKFMPGRSRRITKPLLNAVTTPPISDGFPCSLMETHQLRENQFFLAYAGGGIRKGVDLTLKAYSIYRSMGGERKLVLIGRPNVDLLPDRNWLKTHSDHVHIVTQISDNERDCLYKYSTALIFPSRCEGFGYPLVEAMRQGCPPIAWANTPAAEIIGATVPLMEKLDVKIVADAMQDIEKLSCKSRRELQLNLFKKSMKFSDQDFGSQLLSILKQ